jgi:hypothetical protein
MIEAMKKVLADTDLTPAAKTVAVALMVHWTPDGTKKSDLDKMSGLAKKTVNRAILSLQEGQFVHFDDQNIRIKLNPAIANQKKGSLPLASPSLPRKQREETNKQTSTTTVDVDKTSKSYIDSLSPRQRYLWSLCKTIEFGTNKGPQTIQQNLADPERWCSNLENNYPSLPIGFEMRKAAMWTLSAKKHRKKNLGKFLVNWFETATRHRPQEQLDRMSQNEHNKGPVRVCDRWLPAK